MACKYGKGRDHAGSYRYGAKVRMERAARTDRLGVARFGGVLVVMIPPGYTLCPQEGEGIICRHERCR